MSARFEASHLVYLRKLAEKHDRKARDLARATDEIALAIIAAQRDGVSYASIAEATRLSPRDVQAITDRNRLSPRNLRSLTEQPRRIQQAWSVWTCPQCNRDPRSISGAPSPGRVVTVVCRSGHVTDWLAIDDDGVVVLRQMDPPIQ